MKWRIGDAPGAVLERRTTYPDGTHQSAVLRREELPHDRDLAEALRGAPELLDVHPDTVVAFRLTPEAEVDALALADLLVVIPPSGSDEPVSAHQDAVYGEYSWAWSAAFAGLEDRGVYINGERFTCVPLRNGHRGYAVVPRPGPSDEAPTPTFVRTWATWNFFLNDLLDRSIGLTTPRTVCDRVLDSTGSTEDPTATFWDFDEAQQSRVIVEWLRNEGGYFDLRQIALDILEGRRDGEVDCGEEWE